jgi:hypothetical protein
MKHAHLGTLDVARIGLGAMGMSRGYSGAGSDDAESIRTIEHAIDLGVTLLWIPRAVLTASTPTSGPTACSTKKRCRRSRGQVAQRLTI